MRRILRLAAVLFLGACTSGESDLAFAAVSLPPAYASLPDPQTSSTVERAIEIKLDPVQQEAVVAGVTMWMKRPQSAAFGEIKAGRNSNGTITVCGQVEGLNARGMSSGLVPFIGVLMPKAKPVEFVVVEIGSIPARRADVSQLCREAGFAGV